MNLNQLQNHSRFRFVVSGFVAIFAVFLCSLSYAAQDPLPSWNDGSAKTAILGFVAAVTEKGGKDYFLALMAKFDETIAAIQNDKNPPKLRNANDIIRGRK